MLSQRIAIIVFAGIVAGGTASTAYAQRFEFGGGGGASFYNKQSVAGTSGSVDAGFKPGYGFSAFLGQLGDRLGGELRYTYLSNEMELSSGGTKFTMGGRSQAIHYDLNFYFDDRKAKTRPYVLVGGGMKGYTGTGATVPIQPFIATVVLTNTTQWKPLLTAGGGIRMALSPKVHLRAEVRAYMTQSPNNVITPTNGAKLDGWLFDIVPMVNLSYVW